MILKDQNWKKVALALLIVMSSSMLLLPSLALAIPDELNGTWEGSLVYGITSYHHILEVSENGQGVYGYHFGSTVTPFLFTFQEEDVTTHIGFFEIELNDAPGNQTAPLIRHRLLFVKNPMGSPHTNLIIHGTDGEVAFSLALPLIKPTGGIINSGLYERIKSLTPKTEN